MELRWCGGDSMSRPRLIPQARRLGGDAALVSVSQLFSYAYPLVSLPLLSRTLGVGGLGVFATILVLIQLLHVDGLRVRFQCATADVDGRLPRTAPGGGRGHDHGQARAVGIRIDRPDDRRVYRSLASGVWLVHHFRGAGLGRRSALPDVVPAGYGSIQTVGESHHRIPIAGARGTRSDGPIPPSSSDSRCSGSSCRFCCAPSSAGRC